MLCRPLITPVEVGRRSDQHHPRELRTSFCALSLLPAPADLHHVPFVRQGQPEEDMEEQLAGTGVDPEVLRERLASHAEAAPSQPQQPTPFAAAANGDEQTTTPKQRPRYWSQAQASCLPCDPWNRHLSAERRDDEPHWALSQRP